MYIPAFLFIIILHGIVFGDHRNYCDPYYLSGDNSSGGDISGVVFQFLFGWYFHDLILPHRFTGMMQVPRLVAWPLPGPSPVICDFLRSIHLGEGRDEFA